MKVVVPIKRVAHLDDDFEMRSDGRDVDRDFIDWDLNEWDAFSLEAAAQLSEAAGEGEGEVVAVTVDDEESEDVLRGALARGADRAVRVWDDSLEDADLMAVARVLAGIVERESPDLVLCGVQSSDMVNGATGVALAGFAGLPRAAVVTSFSYDASDGSVVAERELEGGLVDIQRLPTPALLTIQTGINEPRYASMRATRKAREKPLDELTLADVGLDADTVRGANSSRVAEMVTPPEAEKAEILEGDADAIATRVAEIIKSSLGGQ